MITRIWHGRTKKEDADIYKQYVIDTGIQDYLKTEGNLDVEIWQGDEGNETHIFTVTHWDSFDSMKNPKIKFHHHLSRCLFQDSIIPDRS